MFAILAHLHVAYVSEVSVRSKKAVEEFGRAQRAQCTIYTTLASARFGDWVSVQVPSV